MNFLIRVLVIAAVSFGLAHLLGGVHVTDFWTACSFKYVCPANFDLSYTSGYIYNAWAFFICCQYTYYYAGQQICRWF